MIILGIDPGTLHCGYGILETERRQILSAGCDVISVNPKLELVERVTLIYDGLKKVLLEYQPDMAAVETIFYGKSIRAAFALGHVRGAILLLLNRAKIPIFEYSPREVKKSVVGNGNAHKKQVQYMLSQNLGIDLAGVSEDATDALAIAICHYNRIRITL
ncbi:MAG: crossover junction endodeoxyribonuclease RuvC [Candidatus Stygibacter australis]|nr:crossover junction endodeoxyribonuclease RuvC [Candidatus Stygibacter australis]